MIYKQLSDVPHREYQAIIINVGTRLVTTLSLFSALNNTRMPVLLIDCPFRANENKDFDFFRLLLNEYEFDLIQLPLKTLAMTWEDVFKYLSADYILFIDSDLEVRNADFIDSMKRMIKKDNVFGAGFTHGGLWFKKHVNWEEDRDGLFEMRIWTPLTLLKVKFIKEALDANVSFEFRFVYNVLPKFQRLSRKLLYSKKINKFKFFQHTSYRLFDFFKKTYYDQKPLIVFYDSGSDIYNFLRYQKNYTFAGFDIDSIDEEDYLKHYNGITRKLLYDDPYNTGALDIIEIKNALIQKYSFDYDKWNEKFLKIN